MATTGVIGSARDSTLMAFLSATLASVMLPLARTMPGQSSSLTLESSCTSCIALVTPGVEPVGQARDLFRELIRELFPTLGRPTTPVGHVATGKDHAGAVQQLDFGVQLHLLHSLSHAGSGACGASSGPFQRVDQRALSHIGQAD